MNRIVVGVDGSRTGMAAFAWAVELAAQTGATVQAVTAYDFTHAWIDMNVPDYDEWRAQAERATAKVLDATIEATLDEGTTTVAVDRTVVEGAPARLLLDASRNADLLVVGSRGLGGFKGLLLGSVSQQCVTHADVPVVVVPQSD